MVLVRYEVKERAQGQLLSGISSGALSLSLKPGEGAKFPTSYPFVLTVEKVTTNAYGVKTVTAFEDVKCTLRSTDTFTIQRGFNGTTALAFDADDYVSLYCTAIVIDDMQDAIQDMETNKLNRTGQLRLGNTARRLPYFWASGNEVELAFSTSGYVLQTNGATSAPTWVAPSVNITGLTEDTMPDGANDFLLMYDTSAGTNKKVKPNNIPVNIAWLTNETSINFASGGDQTIINDISEGANNRIDLFHLLSIGKVINGTRAGTGAGSVNYAHGLGKLPRFILFLVDGYIMTATGFWCETGSACLYDQTGSGTTKWTTTSYPIYCYHKSGTFVNGTVTVDATNVAISRSDTTGGSVTFVALVV